MIYQVRVEVAPGICDEVFEVAASPEQAKRLVLLRYRAMLRKADARMARLTDVEVDHKVTVTRIIEAPPGATCERCRATARCSKMGRGGGNSFGEV
jgi:hypothetical protein